MKKKRGITQDKFIAYHEGLKKQLIEIKKLLKKAHKLAEPIAKKSYKLLDLGDTLYIEGKGGFIKPSFEDLPSMMADFEFWCGIDNDIEHVIENI